MNKKIRLYTCESGINLMKEGYSFYAWEENEDSWMDFYIEVSSCFIESSNSHEGSYLIAGNSDAKLAENGEDNNE